MKTAVVFAVATATLGLAPHLVSQSADASNYPPGYCNQNVRVLEMGPALFAHVGSGCGDHQVIGYKNSGILAAHNPDAIDAVIVGSCDENGVHHRKTSVVRLGREWHGNGYLSEAHSYSNYKPSQCWNAKIEVAFSANGNWDSLGGANYVYEGYGFYGRNDVTTFNTNEVGYGQVNLAAWAFIVDQLR